MKFEDYVQEMADLKTKHNNEINQLKRKYALANNPIKIGDIITDGKRIIKVQKIFVYLDDPPYCVYRGPLLNKNKTIKKNGKYGDIYQNWLTAKG